MKSRLSTYESTLENNVEYYCWVYYDGNVNATLILKYHQETAEYGHMIGEGPKYDKIGPYKLEKGWNKVIVDNRFPIVD